MISGQAIVPIPFSDEVQILTQTNLCCVFCGTQGIWIKYAEVGDDPKLTKPAEAHCPNCERSFTYLCGAPTGLDVVFAHHIKRQIEWQQDEEIRLATEWWESMTPEEQQEKKKVAYARDMDYSPLMSFMKL